MDAVNAPTFFGYIISVLAMVDMKEAQKSTPLIKVSLYAFIYWQDFLFTFSAKNFGRISQLEVNIKEDGNRFRTDFQRFIGTLASSQSERRDQVEMNIMRGWK